MNNATMAGLATAAILLLFGNPTLGGEDILFAQPTDFAGGLVPSSWVGQATPTATDSFAYGNFVVSPTGDIHEIRWRGGYIGGDQGNRVVVFLISFYATNYLDMPDANTPYGEASYMRVYNTGGNADETPAGTYGGVTMYDYRYVLDPPLPAYVFSTYWVKIEAVQGRTPNWGIATATRGLHYSFTQGRFMQGAGQLAFSLLGKKAPEVTSVPEPAAGSGAGG